jgi:hypothetical protein
VGCNSQIQIVYAVRMQRRTTLGHVLLFNVSDSKDYSQSDTIHTIPMSERCDILRETPPYLLFNDCQVLTQSSADNVPLSIRSLPDDAFNDFLSCLRNGWRSTMTQKKPVVENNRLPRNIFSNVNIL